MQKLGEYRKLFLPIDARPSMDSQLFFSKETLKFDIRGPGWLLRQQERLAMDGGSEFKVSLLKKHVRSTEASRGRKSFLYSPGFSEEKILF